MNSKIKMLNHINEFCELINKNNGSLYKLDILGKYKEDKHIERILKYVYDPNIMFNITSKNVIKRIKLYESDHKNSQDMPKNKYTNIFDLLDDLNNRVITGNDAINCVISFICSITNECTVKDHSIYKQLIFNIIDKNLKIRINATQINKVYKNLIILFKPALADKYDSKIITDKFDWYISRKYDGVRCLTLIESCTDTKCADPIFYSREGKIFDTLHVLGDYIKSNICPKIDGKYYLDGEICILKDNKENFTDIMKVIKRKNFQIKNPKYIVFDLIPYIDFHKGISKDKLTIRYSNLIKFVPKKSTYVEISDQIKYNKLSLLKMAKISETNNWEGLMIRKDAPYKGKRTKDMLKYKIFQDEEFKVLDAIFSKMRMINKNTGLEEEIMCLSSVIIDYGNTNVGSGFSQEERIYYYKHPEKIIGKYITVKYMEKTKDSLRFPIFKHLYDKKKDT